MPKQVIITDRNDLNSITLPDHGESYTVISHDFIITEVLSQLQNKGLKIEKEEYCRNLNGEVATGIYHISEDTDSDIGLVFTWTNSYDKTMRFKCAIGAYDKKTGSRYIAEYSNGKVHSGENVKDDIKAQILNQINEYNKYLSQLITDKNSMKDITINEDEVANLMGLLFFKEGIITSSQLINIKNDYNNSTDTSLWSVYQHITVALMKSHPKHWLEQQKDVHSYIKNMFFTSKYLTQVIEDKSQLSLLDSLDECNDVIANYDAHMKLDCQVATEFPTPPEDVPEFKAPDLFCQMYNTEETPNLQNPCIGHELESASEELAQELSNSSMEVLETVFTNEEVIHELDNVVEDIIPLEEQVAGEYISNVSKEEIEISIPPIIDKPVIVDNDAVDFDPQLVEKEESIEENNNPFIF